MDFKNFFYFFPIMLYYFIESAFIAIFIHFAWIFANLTDLITTLSGVNYKPSYFQWIVVIWTIKLILFDIFKLTPNHLDDFQDDKEQQGE